MSDFRIDFTKTLGKFKPTNGVVNGPRNEAMAASDTSKYFKLAKIPFVRLHDTIYPNAAEVDISEVFPNFDADADKPESYDFARTDIYLRDILATGAEVFYRLGETIEHHSVKKDIKAPKDAKQWAKIALGIMKHYNEGWADGFEWNIKNWDIWEEADNEPLWQGTDEQYYELYSETATLLKSHDPSVKVGGYAACKPFPRPFMRGFLEYIKKTGAPLDYFTIDIYTDNPETFAYHSNYTRNVLDDYGFKNTTVRIAEWNVSGIQPLFDSFFGEKCHESRTNHMAACFDAASMIYMQDLPIENAAYYCADTFNPFSMFNYFGTPYKAYWAFVMIKDLFELERAEATVDKKYSGIYVGASAGENKKVIVAANFGGESGEFSFDINLPRDSYILRAYLIDETHTNELIEVTPYTGGVYKRYIPKYGTLEVVIEKA